MALRKNSLIMGRLVLQYAKKNEAKKTNVIAYFRSMQRMIQHIYIIPLLICMLLSLKSFRLKWPISYRIFSILLFCVFTVELFAIIWKYYLHGLSNSHFSKSNLWLYNLFLIPQYILYLAVYYNAFASKNVKKVIIITGGFFLCFAILNIIFFQPINTVNSYTLLFADLIVIFLTVSYFEELRKQKDIINLTQHPLVWISLGAFIFHSANIPYLLSLEFLIHNNVSLAITLFYIYLGLNCLMYSFYTIAFLCQNPHQK
jgi:hypothetical protein